MRAAERHEETVRNFELLFAANPLPMWVYDLATLAFLEVNTAAIEHYGYSRHEFLAMRITDIRPARDVTRLEANVAQRAGMATSDVTQDEGTWQHRVKDGRIRDVAISAQRIDFAGRRAALVVALDVTEHQQTQRHLAHYAARLDLLHEIDKAVIAADEPLAIAERAIRRLRELLQVPRAIVNLFDLASNEAEWLVAAGRHRVHQGPGVRFSMEFMGDLDGLRRGELQVLDTARLPSGPEVDALLGSGVHTYMVVPMIAKGELIGGLSFGGEPGEFSVDQISMAREVAAQLAIAIAQARLYERVKQQAADLERRVQERTLELQASNEKLEQEIVERRRAEAEAARANQLKSEFLANMSHELRTPLNAILGFTELLQDGQVTGDMPEYQEFLGDILASGRHLLQLINDVLDLSKVEAGKLEFRPEAIDVAVLVGEVQNILRTTAASKAIRLEAAVDPGLTEVVLDAARFKQVLYNYVSNALKFTPQGGRVMVRAFPVAEGALRVEVEDSGIGIAPEDIGRLFVEFLQLDAGMTKKHAGTGLGLALTKRLVEAQGGTVGVHSTLHRGSTFHATFPRQHLPPEGALVGSFGTARADAPIVLVIEDTARDEARLVSALTHAGYRVETAATGAQALAKCRERAFDAITLDLLLPDMSGLDVLRAIREESLNCDVPVITITVVTERGVVAGFTVHDLLSKPVDRKSLVASLRRAGVVASSAGSVLVVDDDPAALRLMTATLEQLGYPVVPVQRGADALRAASASPPVAVVLDLLMPEMDGFTFLEFFRECPRCRDVPVIVWTAKDLPAEELGRLRSSAQDVIAKGHDANAVVLRKLEHLLSSSTQG